MAAQLVRSGTQLFDLFGQGSAANQHCAIRHFNKVKMAFFNPVINFAAAALAQCGGSFGGNQTDSSGTLVAASGVALIVMSDFLSGRGNNSGLVFICLQHIISVG